MPKRPVAQSRNTKRCRKTTRPPRSKLLESRRRSRDRAAIKIETHRSIQVRSINAYTRSLETLQGFKTRESERISCPDRDDGSLRFHGRDEFLCRSIRTAVMPHLQKICTGMMQGDYSPFDLLLRIAFQQHRCGAIAHPEYHGIIVARLVPHERVTGWIEDLNRSPA